jgi:predicted DNA-binding protein (MmcQ/YjbR family)
MHQLSDFIQEVLKLGPVTYDTPFDQNTLVFRVGGKIFLLTDITQWDINQPRINIKALPDNVEKYLSNYDFVYPGYHMNKKHWITVDINACNTPNVLYLWIENSYHLVYNSLSKKIKTELKTGK